MSSAGDLRVALAALSNLFLDTEVSDLSSYIVDELSSTAYAVEELEAILAHEVYPVCCWNLWSVAGEWSAIDQDWLAEQIEKKRGKPGGFVLRMMGKRFVRKNADWQQIKLAFVVRRPRQ